MPLRTDSLWTAYPSGGGFDERTPLICLHHAGGSGRFFAPMLRELGHDRSVYAPDLPATARPMPRHARAGVADLAGAVGDFLDSLRLRQVDIFGYQLGALIAAELAIARPQQVRRVMLWGVPCIRRRSAVACSAAGALGVREDGATSSKNGVARSSVAAQACRDGVRKISAIACAPAPTARERLRAALDYPATERLPLVKQPTLVLRLTR